MYNYYEWDFGRGLLPEARTAGVIKRVNLSVRGISIDKKKGRKLARPIACTAGRQEKQARNKRHN